MERIVVKGKWREKVGKKAARALRLEGQVPAVLYGREGSESLHVSLSREDVERMLRSHNKLVEVRFSDGKAETGLIKEVQVDPVTDEVLHLDLVHVDLAKPVEVLVEIEFIGHPKGVKEGGKFSQDMADLPLICLPTQIPETIQVRISDLDIGDHITAGEIELPEGVKLAIPPDTVICHVKAFMPGVELEAEQVDENAEPEVIGKEEKGEDSEQGG